MADASNFFYQNRESCHECETKQNVTHCVRGRPTSRKRRDDKTRKRFGAASSPTMSKGGPRSASTNTNTTATAADSSSSSSPSYLSAVGASTLTAGGGGGGGGDRNALAATVTATTAGDGRRLSNVARCYAPKPRLPREKCSKTARWQRGEYRRDECGSGVVPVRANFPAIRKKMWCRTPLSTYQATIGELGRAILCGERAVPRDVRPGPPCNVEAFVLPPCRGYYRRYDCLRPCEDEYAEHSGGRKVYRNAVDRYWEPCAAREHNGRPDIDDFAGQNVFLSAQLRRKHERLPCW